MNLGKKIVEIRNTNQMSQEEFAELFHVTRQTISSWENEKSYPDIETLIKISDHFKISLDTLLKEDKMMVKKLDRNLKNNRKLKALLAFFGVMVVLIAGVLLYHRGVKIQQEKMENERYQQIITQIKGLGFKSEPVGFYSMEEDGITYKIYSKRPIVLSDPYITAMTEWRDEEAIIVDFEGSNIKVSYLNESGAMVYCDEKGNLKNKVQNKRYIEAYHRYQERTKKMIIRMVELYNYIYSLD